MDTSKIQSDIEKTINGNCIVIYGKRSCPYCVMARKVFEDLKVDFLEIDINKQPNPNQIQNVLQQITGARSVPRVFIGGNCIGGGSETKALQSQGKLLPMIQQCQG